jgi:PPOX class probable F420-dependent enzyme
MNLSPYRVIVLETYRKSGEGVATPIWFVQDGDTVYVRTYAHCGKVKRLRNNLMVRLAGCDAAERPVTDWIIGRTEILNSTAAEHAYTLLDRRYGVKAYDSGRGDVVVIAIHLGETESTER